MRTLREGKNRKLFIHIPKTGGVSVERVIDAMILCAHHNRKMIGGLPARHMTKSQLERHFDFYGYYTFTIVRHPVDWYVSVWRWMVGVHQKRINRNQPINFIFRNYYWNPTDKLLERFNESFSKFIDAVYNEIPGYLSYLYDLYCGTINKPEVDYICRTETLTADLKKVLGVTEVPQANKGTFPKPSVTMKDVRLILSSEEEAIERFYSPTTIKYRLAKRWTK